MRLFLMSIIMLVTCVASAQYQSYVDGSPVTIIKKVDVEGSEMLYETWLPATVKNSRGQQYKSVMIKYNLLEDVPYFLGKADEAMSFSVPLVEFVIRKENGQQQKFKSGFPPVDKFTNLTFYEVLVDGNVKLLKKVSKKIMESRAYNSATTV